MYKIRAYTDLVANYAFVSPEEERMATTFTDLQLKGIANLSASFAVEKIQLAVDPADRDKFFLAHEYYRGCLDALKYLIELHYSNTPQE